MDATRGWPTSPNLGLIISPNPRLLSHVSACVLASCPRSGTSGGALRKLAFLPLRTTIAICNKSSRVQPFEEQQAAGIMDGGRARRRPTATCPISTRIAGKVDGNISIMDKYDDMVFHSHFGLSLPGRQTHRHCSEWVKTNCALRLSLIAARHEIMA